MILWFITFYWAGSTAAQRERAQEDFKALYEVVSFAAVIRVVTQCSSPTNGCSLKLCFPFLKLTNKEQASISWKPGPLAANVMRNIIGAAANSYMHVIGSQEQREKNAELEWPAVSWGGALRDDPNNGCEGDYIRRCSTSPTPHSHTKDSHCTGITLFFSNSAWVLLRATELSTFLEFWDGRDLQVFVLIRED